VLCKLFGKTRHAYYDYLWRLKDSTLEEDIILQHVHAVRKDLPRLGSPKLLLMIGPQLRSHHIKIGRDSFYNLMRDHKLLIIQRKRKMNTTNSRHWMRKYTNLSTTVEISGPDQLWVSDMTYIRLINRWGYLSLITDAYSRKIVGYCFRTDMLAIGCVEALQMAISNRKDPNNPLMHHSDRGSQYCCKDYVDTLVAANISISMKMVWPKGSMVPLNPSSICMALTAASNKPMNSLRKVFRHTTSCALIAAAITLPHNKHIWAVGLY